MQVLKQLGSNNPQAPHNLFQFSFKERIFKGDQNVDQMVYHVSIDGNILMKDSEDHQDQNTFLETNKTMQKQMLTKMNKEIENLDNKPLDVNDFKVKKSLRNQFNYQERSSQTFNMPLR